MTWNYRVVKHRAKRETFYGLHEVYYRKNGKMYLWSPEPEAIGSTKGELIEALAMMLRDATKDAPVLKKNEMPGEGKKDKLRRKTR